MRFQFVGVINEVAALPLGLRGDAIEFVLLLGSGVLVSAQLLGAGRIATAAEWWS